MQTLSDSIHQRSQHIAWRTERLALRCGRESVHQLRVDIKHLRSAFRLLRDVDRSFDYKKIYRPYKKLFAKAGILREIQLQTHLLESDKRADPPFKSAYQHYLNRQYKGAREAFRLKARCTTFRSWDQLEEMTAPAVERCRQERIERYFDHLRRRIREHIEQIHSCTDEDLHDLRKAIKDYEANRKLVNRFFKFKPEILTEIPIETHELLDKIGTWHDYLIATQRLKNDINTANWSPEITALSKNHLMRWRRKCKNLRVSLIKSLEITVQPINQR